MPVKTLQVEGDLDAQLLFAIFGGPSSPLIINANCSKNALSPRVRTDREKGAGETYYLRDRDFDYLPPKDLSTPTADGVMGDKILGWRWARHEIENYMLEPSLLGQFLNIDRTICEKELIRAARSIRYYQAARWTIGQARFNLPPTIKFGTAPDERSRQEFYLPADLERANQACWANNHARSFLHRVTPVLSESEITHAYAGHADRFTDDFLGDCENILVWFSGKDLFKALEPWLLTCNLPSAGSSRSRMRDWMRKHSDRVVQFLPEWSALISMLRQ